VLIELDGPVDLVRTLAPLAHHSPTMRVGPAPGEVWRATRTPEGPATIRLRQRANDTIDVDAYGDGAGWALAHAPDLVGAHDDPTQFRPTGNAGLRDLHRRHPGIRIPTTHAIAEALVPIVLEQKVQMAEAQASYRILVHLHSDPAPGPHGRRLRLPPHPRHHAGLPYWHFHHAGVEKRRADTVRRVATHARQLDAGTASPRAIPGIGAWTIGELGMRATGDADAVPVGDYHLPHLVAFALAGEPRATDERMLELLEPYRPHRARVIRLLTLSGIRPPRYGPRMPRSPLSRVSGVSRARSGRRATAAAG
jgi:3-methyladenine DNA glycosylase/8-oxoguanine DNA glycosylase